MSDNETQLKLVEEQANKTIGIIQSQRNEALNTNVRLNLAVLNLQDRVKELESTINTNKIASKEPTEATAKED